MTKQDNLWNTVVTVGMNSYNSRLNQARYSTIVLVGAPKSVILDLCSPLQLNDN